IQPAAGGPGDPAPAWPLAAVEPRQHVADRPELPADDVDVRQHVEPDADRGREDYVRPLLKAQVEPEQHQREHHHDSGDRGPDVKPDQPAIHLARGHRRAGRLFRQQATARQPGGRLGSNIDHLVRRQSRLPGYYRLSATNAAVPKYSATMLAGALIPFLAKNSPRSFYGRLVALPGI